MKVHHLNCGSMNSTGGQVGDNKVGIPLVCHCLLVETAGGLVLVDTGFGSQDIHHAQQRFRPEFLRLANPVLDLAETAAHQVRALGYEAEDVRDIVLTHLHHDHTGGLEDFPSATVHVGSLEHDTALTPPNARESTGYQPLHWAHQPQWERYDANGEAWFGFPAARPLRGLDDDFALIPLYGHSRGHCGVAVHTTTGWMLHAGDAYFFHGEMDPDNPHCPPAHANVQRATQIDGAARQANNQRLLELRRQHASEVQLFCAHDPIEWGRYV